MTPPLSPSPAATALETHSLLPGFEAEGLTRRFPFEICLPLCWLFLFSTRNMRIQGKIAYGNTDGLCSLLFLMTSPKFARCFKANCSTYRKSCFMKWLCKIFKGASHAARNGWCPQIVREPANGFTFFAFTSEFLFRLSQDSNKEDWFS
ncbi:uncharacterized protein LOC103713090 isoform X4 [Phoenix dactylifera]|uniref:Uncharacterized protein LOC103713090 isoform X4 n=1 Tax=Phoenix dactylifera TaxID=42345 RepID=A0A8B9AWD9_PHODC|nr:uncharacterized protein LOC103713090 isoform X4 [Phoenix dactylifera]